MLSDVLASSGVTNLSGSGTASVYTIESDTGTNAAIPPATNAAAGVATAAHITELEALRSDLTSVQLDTSFDSVSALISDTNLTYTLGSVYSVSSGDIIAVKIGGFAYEVAASLASDNDLITSGGVKLYVKRGAAGYDITQMNPAADGVTDDRSKIQKLIDKAAAEGGGVIWFPHEEYAIASSLVYKTGVTLSGVGRQTSKIKAISSMTYMVQPSDTSGFTDTFRHGLRKIWLDGNNLAVYNYFLVSTRDSLFEEVYTSGATSGGWLMKTLCYYNHWYSCTDNNSSSRGWVIYEDNGGSTGSNENHWYSCRKNSGTDGWYIQTVNTAINSIKLNNCVVEAHSGKAVHLVAAPGFQITNFATTNMRVDSSAVSPETITFNGADVVRPVVDNLFSSGAAAIQGDASDPQLRGYPYRLTGTETIDFSSTPPNSVAIHTWTISEAGGVNTTDWVITINPTGGGALSTGIAGWSARISGTNTAEIRVHIYGTATIDPVSQDFLWVAERVKI